MIAPYAGQCHVAEEPDPRGPSSAAASYRHTSGTRTYVVFHPYVLQSTKTPTVGMYPKPKEFADIEPAIGEVISSKMDWLREEQIGSGQACQFPKMKRIVTAWSDPAFPTPDYQEFLRDLCCTKIRTHEAYGKPVNRR
jgi:hypothetical protein